VNVDKGSGGCRMIRNESRLVWWNGDLVGGLAGIGRVCLESR
jgi:hypothetical protein